MKVLVTGGAGYIGSHTVVELINSGHEVVIVDNLSNARYNVVSRLEQITDSIIPFYVADCRDKQALSQIFRSHKFDAVMHFAGLKAVGESVTLPLFYYQNNLDSTLTLCEVMQEHEVNQLVFSSSATVYGEPDKLPISESQKTGQGITNPYGQTKFMIEQILRDLAKSDNNLRVCTLRYFNPIGAHETGMIGEEPDGLPNNLMPYIAKVATGEFPQLNVYGDNYKTVDGTGVRDYIHVVDLAKGHVAALRHMPRQISRVEAYNLGTGQGTSVFELVYAFEQVTGVKIKYQIVDRRPGDVPTCYADVSKAERELGWRATKTIQEACKDTWRWQYTSAQLQPVKQQIKTQAL